MLQPSNPWNPDKSVGSSSRKNNQYSVEIKKNFLRFCVQAMEEKRTPTYEQKIEFLRGEMPEWIETKMQRPFRLWHEKKELYLPPNECERYDALFV